RAAAAGPLAQRLSPKYLEEHCLLPLAVAEGGALVVAAGLPLDPTVIDELCWTFERQVRLVEAPAAEIHAAILSAQSEAAPELQARSEEHTSELQSRFDLVCRLLLEK